MYEMQIEDLKYEIKELKRILKQTEDDAQYEAIEDEIFERESEIKRLEEEIENLKYHGQYYSDDDLGIAEYGMED